MSNGCYGYAGWSSYVGANGHYEHAVWNGRCTKVPTPGAIARTPAASTDVKPASDGRYEQVDWIGRAIATRHYEAGMAGVDKYARMAGVSEHLQTAGATRYVNAGGYAMPIGTTKVTWYAAWAVLLVPSGNTCLTGVMNLPFTAE